MRNPLAPPIMQGIQETPSFDFVDISFNYTYYYTLGADQRLDGQVVSIYPDADFMLRGLIVDSDGPFGIQFQDGQGYYLSDALVDSRTLTNTPGDPFPVFPEVQYYAGGRIYFNIQDRSSANNNIRILFIGVSRYRKTTQQGITR